MMNNIVEKIAEELHCAGLDAHRDYKFMGKSGSIWNEFREKLAAEIYKHRKEIGLYTLDDIEIDVDEIEKTIFMKLMSGKKANCREVTEDLAKAIAKAKPIRVVK